MLHQSRRTRLLATAALAVCAFPLGARAQDIGEGAQLEEVIVTAQRVAERLQDVPVSVTALNARELESRQVVDVKSLSSVAPNITFAQTPQDPTDISIGIRGVFLQPAHLVFDPVIGVYVNGVYISRTSGANTGFVDMERVEVLRGPQGTLFGRNTVGGALNITSQAPTDRFEGYLTAELGNYEARNFTGVVNLPVVPDKIDARLVYQHLEHSGFAHTDAAPEDELSDLNQDYVRGSLRFRMNENWQATVVGDYLKLHNNSMFVGLAYVVPNSPSDLYPASVGRPTDRVSNYTAAARGDFWASSTELNPKIDVETYSLASTVDGAFGPAKVKWISGFRKEVANRPGDNETAPYQIFALPDKPFKYRQVSQELQFYGDLMEGRLKWITGAFWFEEKGRQGQITLIRPATSPAAGVNDARVENSSEGVFAQLTYELLPKLRLTGGVRYTVDHRQAIYLDRARVNATGAEICNVAVSIRDRPDLCQATTENAKFDYVPWTVGLDYKPSDTTLVYAKVSRGYRSGGFLQGGAASPVQIQPYGPERLTSYEGGAKLELLDRRLRVNAAAYWSKYEAIQQTAFVPGPGGLPVGITANVGTAEIKGGELEVSALLGAARIHAGLGLADPKYTEGPLVGQPFIQVSKTTASIGGEYPIELDMGTLRLSADYVWQSKQHFFIPTNLPAGSALAAGNPVAVVNAAATEGTTQDGYGLVNARVAFELKSAPVTVALWGRNLADKAYKTRAADYVSAGLGIIPYWAGDPRTYGVSLTYRFGE